MDHHIEGGHYYNKKQSRLRFRQSILNNWNNSCAYCGTDLGKAATLDHVHPKMRGGETHQQNLVACCFTCNISKSAQHWVSWYRKQEFWSLQRERQIIWWLAGDLAA